MLTGSIDAGNDADVDAQWVLMLMDCETTNQR